MTLSNLARARATADQVLARVAVARASVRTLRGPFAQTRTIALLATEVRSHGMLTLVRPERMRWDLGPPDDVTFWLGPEGLAFRGAHGGGRLARSQGRVGEALDDLRILLGGDIARLHDHWQVTVARDDGAGVEIEATPRAGASISIRRVRLALAGDLVRPTTISVFEGERDQTHIEFGELVVNAPISDADMLPPR
jgi:hypothetical protein